MPPFTSQEPRPYTRPPSIAGSKGGMVIPSTGTVSWCTSKSNVRRASGAS